MIAAHLSAMDALTLYGLIVWGIFIICPMYIVTAVAVLFRRWLEGRRKDREWAAGIACKFREREYLEWLEAQFDAEQEDA